MDEKQKEYINSMIRALEKAKQTDDINMVLKSLQYVSVEVRNFQNEIYENAPRAKRGNEE